MFRQWSDVAPSSFQRPGIGTHSGTQHCPHSPPPIHGHHMPGRFQSSNSNPFRGQLTLAVFSEEKHVPNPLPPPILQFWACTPPPSSVPPYPIICSSQIPLLHLEPELCLLSPDTFISRLLPDLISVLLDCLLCDSFYH